MRGFTVVTKSYRDKPHHHGERTKQHRFIRIPCIEPATTALSQARIHCTTNTATDNVAYPYSIMTLKLVARAVIRPCIYTGNHHTVVSI